MNEKCVAAMPPKQLSDLMECNNRITETIDGQLTVVINQLFGEEPQCGENIKDVRNFYDAAELLNEKLYRISGKLDTLLARL